MSLHSFYHRRTGNVKSFESRMTDTEFLSRLPKGARKPTEKEFETIQFSCRIRAHNFNAAMEAANAYVKDKAEILSLSLCPAQ